MNKKAIETLSVNAVRDSIVLSPLLDQFIPDDDKEPSWDGHVYIYNDISKRKDRLEGRMPVQVKGKVFDDLSKDEITYSMSTADLRNYLNDGGAVLFVVYLSNGGASKKIYYSELAPLKLRFLLESAGSQATKVVRLKAFPNDPNSKATIFLNCLQNCQKQASFKGGKIYTVEELQKMGVLEGLTIPLAGVAGGNPNTVFFNCDNYLYAKLKGASALQPLGIISKGVTEEKRSVPVSVDGKQYYSNYTLISDSKTNTFKFGDSLTIKLEKDDSSGTINYHSSRSLRNSAVDIEFFFDAIAKQQIELNGQKLPFDLQLDKLHGFDVDAEKGKLLFAQRSVQALEALGFKGDIDMAELADEDYRNLSRLAIAFVDNRPVCGLNPDIPPVAYMAIGKIKLILTFTKDENTIGQYQLADFFKSSIYVGYDNAAGEKEPTSKFSILQADDLLGIGNFQPEYLLPSFQAFSGSVNFYRANLFMLELIAAYDRSGGERKEMLNTAGEFDQWLQKESGTALDKGVVQINHYQIIKRKRPLNVDEQAELWGILEDSDYSDVIKVAAYLLLDQQIPAERLLGKLPAEKQDAIKQYPIYHFWKGAGDTNHG